MPKRILAVITLLLALPLHVWCAEGAGRDYVKWRMQDSFSNGIPSWQSYPLAQDIGYDPSIYTTSSGVLVRDVINEGQKTQSVGMIRPLKFRLTASTQISLAYSMHFAGEPISAKIILAGKNGTRYEAPLPLNVDPRRPYVIPGSMFRAHEETDIEAVAILCSMRGAPLGSHSLLTLYSFSLSAVRPAELGMVSPRLLKPSSESMPIVDGFVRAGQPAQFSFSAAPKRVLLKDGSGATVSADVTIQGSQVLWTPSKDAAPGLWTIEAADNQASLRFRVLVLSDSKDTGVLLSADRITQLRADNKYAVLRQAIHREAMRQAQQIEFNPHAGDSIALLPKESVLAGLPAYLALMNNYGGAIAYGALDYRLNGDQQSLANARTALATVAAWKTWTPTWFTAHGMHTYYVVGIFTQQTALGYDLISDRLSPEERSNIENALFSKSIQPTVDDYFLKQRMPTGASNHMAHSVGGAIAAWVACDRANPQWRAQNGASLAELLVAYEDLLKGLFPGDGSEREPAGYAIFAMEGMSYGISALKSLDIVPQGLPAMMESFWWLRYAEVKPQLVLDTGDTSSSLSTLYGYAWIAEHSSDPGARWFYDTVARPVMDSSQTRSKNNEAIPNSLAIAKAPNALELLCCTKAVEKISTPPASRIFPSRGSTVLRQGWGEDQTVISLRVGPWMNHEHHDQGSFQLASGGDLLVGEGGYADYYHDPNYKDYFSEAEAHNVVLLDENPFSQGSYDGDYFKALSSHPRITSSLLSDKIDYLEADLQPAYGDAVTRYRRTFLFLKPDLLIVNDELNTQTPHTFKWLLHAAPGTTPEQRNLGIAIEGKDGHATLTAIASDQSLRWQISPTPIAINDFSNLDRVPVNEPYLLSLESKPSLNARFLVALSVAQSKETSTIERRSTESADLFLQNHASQQTVALFRKRSGLLESSGIATDGDVLAVTRLDSKEESHVFVEHARLLRITGGPSLSWTSSENVVLDRMKRDVVLNLEVEKQSTLKLEGQIEQGSFKLDGANGSSFVGGQGLALEPGKHLILFTLRTGPK